MPFIFPFGNILLELNFFQCKSMKKTEILLFFLQ